jgi:peptidoglycan/LPS O-acetylase OafA/YrhL
MTLPGAPNDDAVVSIAGGTNRNHSLDVLRALAVLMVIGHHYADEHLGFLHAGGFGVDLFFVLSGFLISGLLFSELQSSGSISFRRFFIRRGLKIYPPFYFFLLVTLVVTAANHSWAQFAGEVFFVQSYAPHIWQHTWSLSVEEMFYLGLPLLLVTLARGKRLRWVPYISVSLLAVCLGGRVLTGVYSVAPGGYAQTHLRMDALFAGVALGYFYHFKRDFFLRLSRAWWMGWAGLLLLCPDIASGFVSLSRFGFALLLTSNLLGFAALLWWAQTRSYVRNRALETVGRYSYSIYLWHMPVVMLWHLRPVTVLGLFGDVATSLAVGTGMALVVETPVLRFRDRFFPARSSAVESVVGNPEFELKEEPARPSHFRAQETL